MEARRGVAMRRDGDARAAADGPAVVLVDARTDVERQLIASWARGAYPDATPVHGDDPALARVLEDAGDPLVVPARITWLPRPERAGRRVRLAEALALTDPRRPWPWVQRWIARRQPDRARVTAGEPSRVSALRARFDAQEAGGGPAAFGGFVARQALLACDRAERQLIGDRYKVPRLVAEQISASVRFRTEARALATQLGRREDDVITEAIAALEELAAVQSPLAIDAYRALMSPLHSRAWTVDVDEHGLDELRRINKQHSLVFLPSHRSYADPLVLAQILHEHDFPRNHTLGGKNMSFWPIGPIGKRAGFIYIRRSFADDPVYKLAIREYFGHLVAKRFNLEWYLEGGRTRTGKLRPPRFGLLRYLVGALEDARADDVILVPVSIIYDQLPEVRAMAAEQTGTGKSAEGLRWLADYIRAHRRNVGEVHVRFGEPFSLRSALADAGESSAQLEKVAFRVCDGINRATPVTATAVVTFALLDVRDRALTFDQVVRVTAPLLDLLDAHRVAGPLERLRHRRGIREALDMLVAGGIVNRYEGGTEPVWWIASGRHHHAAFYRNALLHHVVNRAITELTLLWLADRPRADDPIETAWEEALRLRDLLKFEFFFADKRRFRQELRAELELIDPAWQERIATPQAASKLLGSSGTLVAHRALRAFFDAQRVLARTLVARDPRHPVDPSALADECLGLGRQLLLQGELHGAESVSRELYATAVRLAANRDLLDPGREELTALRRAYLAEVEEIVKRLVRIGELDARLLQEALGGHA